MDFQAYYETIARPFEWKFTRADLTSSSPSSPAKSSRRPWPEGQNEYVTELTSQST